MTTLHPIVAAKAQTGFSLVEIAIVLLVLGLLAGSVMIPLNAQVERRYYRETARTLNDVRDALLGYTVVNRRLPCPDTDGDGTENASAGACTNAQGNLPWATIGIGTDDAWGQPFLYRVTPAFANPSAIISLASSPDMRICQSAGCTTTPNVVAVVISGGKNQGNCSGLCPDDLENRDNDVTFVSRIPSEPGGGNEFDDVLVWVTSANLFSRMIAAHLLP